MGKFGIVDYLFLYLIPQSGYMNKEQMLDDIHWDFVVERGISSVHSRTFPEAYRRQAILAMEEYAMVVAIGFHKWVDETFLDIRYDEDYFEDNNRNDVFVQKEMSQAPPIRYTIHQLYNVYQELLKEKEGK